MKRLLPGALLLAALMAACGGRTLPAQTISNDSASLRAEGHCDANDEGRVFWEYRRVGASAWTRQFDAPEPRILPQSGSSTETDPCTSRLPGSGEAGLNEPIKGLHPGTKYEYRIGFRFTNNTEATADRNGSTSAGAWDTFTTQLFNPGVNADADLTPSVNAADSINARVARVEFDIGTATSAMEATIDAYADQGIRVLLLANWDNNVLPTVSQAQSLANWANAFGAGGSFWSGRTDGHLAVQQIEFGNEDSACYRHALGPNGTLDCGGAWYNDSDYFADAQQYASRAKDASLAIALTGTGVDLLVNGDDGGSGSDNWVNQMFAGVSNLGAYVGGWTVHPYGPRSRWEPKIDRTIARTAANGAPASIPIDATELGIATDNGNALVPDNFGWPTNLTYAQAAADLDQTVSEMRTKYAARLRDFMLFQAHDRADPGTSTDRERFFGAVKQDGSDKGAWTTQVRQVMALPVAASPPTVEASSGSTPAKLVDGIGGARLQPRGVAVWGLQDHITQSFGAQEYANREQVIRTAKAWGSDVIRLRVLAGDYNDAPNAATGSVTKAQYVQRVKDWRDAAAANGMLLMVTGWDALDGDHAGNQWPDDAADYDQMFADIYAALGNDPRVIYEPTNEPNLVGCCTDGASNGHDSLAWNAWDANMKHTIAYFRETLGYRGLLVIDPIWWANSGTAGQGYDDARYDALEAYDAARAGMGGKHALAFAKHDYAQQYASKAWSASAWQAGAGGSQIEHLIFETEFGNYNGDPSTVSDSWAASAATFFGDHFSAQTNYVGGAAFLFGPWFDANAMTCAAGQSPPSCGSDNTTATTWGSSVNSNFLD